MRFLKLSSSRVKCCQIPYICQFWNDKSIPLQILYLFSVSWKIIPLLFSSKNIYFAQKDLIKMKFLRLSVARVKIHQIHHVNFEMTSQLLWWKFAIFVMSFSKPQVRFSSNFASLVSVMKDNSSAFFEVKH